MNIKQSQKNIGENFRLYPPPQSMTFTPAPVPIAEEFNCWKFEGVNRKRQVVLFTHGLGYFREVPFELISGHEPDGRYKLKCRFVINGPAIDLLPS